MVDLPVIGYIKVFATEGQEIRDVDAWPRFRPGGLLVQWLFPYTYDTRELAYEIAWSKAHEVATRLDGAPVSGLMRVRGVNNVYAIRVGTERIEA